MGFVMINIRLLCVGNLKEEFWQKAEKEYAKRLSKFCKLEIIECCEQNKYDDIEKIKEKEGEEIALNLKGKNILFDLGGKELSSEEFASRLENLALTNSTITFIIGGSYGVSEKIKQTVQDKISLGKMTFPHNLARIMLLEQIYRGFMINAGAKYHK